MFLRWSITISPIRLHGTSDRPRSAIFESISPTTFSILPVGSGRLAHALVKLAQSFSWLNSSRRPSRLTTATDLVCINSYVVNLRLQRRHSRLRRTPFPESRESITLESFRSQYGHNILKTDRRGQVWEPTTHCAADRGYHHILGVSRVSGCCFSGFD